MSAGYSGWCEVIIRNQDVVSDALGAITLSMKAEFIFSSVNIHDAIIFF